MLPVPPPALPPPPLARSLALVVAVQQAAIAVLWMDEFLPLTRSELSSHRAYTTIYNIVVTAVAGFILAPVAAKARSRITTVGRCAIFGLAAGALVSVAESLVVYYPFFVLPNARAGHLIAHELQAGAVMGLFSGLAASPLVSHLRRLHDQEPALEAIDPAPQLLAMGGASLLPTALVLAAAAALLSGPVLCTATFVLASTALIAAAAALHLRRVTWRDRGDGKRRRGAALMCAARDGAAAGLLVLLLLIGPAMFLALRVGQ